MKTRPKDGVVRERLPTMQLVSLGICVCLNMLDGFDILAMSFAASEVKAAWHLTDGQLGYLLSAGLIGMGIGSLMIAPWADRFGRRPIVLLAVMLNGVGMIGSMLAPGFAALLILRIVTGIGIGGTIASAAVLVCEYAPDRWRSVALAVYATGYSMGAALGGVLTALALAHFGWRSAFAIGGALSLIFVPVAWRWLPESLEFLLTRRPRSALQRVNEIMRALHRSPLSALPDRPSVEHAIEGRPSSAYALLITRTTMLGWLVFFCAMAGFYFVVSWTPRLLTAAGLSSTAGLTGGLLLNFGGIAGSGLFAWASSRIDARRLLLFALMASGLSIIAFGMVLHDLTIALWTALLIGILINAVMAGLYAVGPSLYPSTVRATGMGSAIGIGRFGAILAPMVTGILLDRGLDIAHLYEWYSLPFGVAVLAVMAIGKREHQ